MRDIYNQKRRYANLLKQIQTMDKNRRIALTEYNGYCVARDLSVARRIKLCLII